MLSATDTLLMQRFDYSHRHRVRTKMD